MAGGVGAKLYGPRWRSTNRGLSPGDREQAQSLLREMGVTSRGELSEATSATMGRVKRRAEAILTEYRGAVLRIAGALRSAPGGELSGPAVERLFNGESVEDVLASPASSALSSTPGDDPAPLSPSATVVGVDPETVRIRVHQNLLSGQWRVAPAPNQGLPWLHWSATPEAGRKPSKHASEP